MNLFVTDYSPSASARNLDDKRVVRLCSETVWLLSATCHARPDMFPAKNNSGLNREGPSQQALPQWVMSSHLNYAWTWWHASALFTEYGLRYGKSPCSHASWAVLNSAYMPDYLWEDALSTMRFYNQSLFKDETNVILAYRKSLRTKWHSPDVRPPQWRIPERRPIWADLDVSPMEGL